MIALTVEIFFVAIAIRPLSVVLTDHECLVAGARARFICQAFDMLRLGRIRSICTAYCRLSLEYICAPWHVWWQILLLILLLLLLETGRQKVTERNICSRGAFLDFEAILLLLLLAKLLLLVRWAVSRQNLDSLTIGRPSAFLVFELAVAQLVRVNTTVLFHERASQSSLRTCYQRA